MKVEITRVLKPMKKFGLVTRFIMPNKSKIYVSKKGWNLVTKDKHETQMSWSEINLAIVESIKLGYVVVKV
jgi:hypothetical protein